MRPLAPLTVLCAALATGAAAQGFPQQELDDPGGSAPAEGSGGWQWA